MSINYAERPVILRAEGLVKRYGSRTVVDGVSIEVHEGEVVGLLGANGAGKTTSFRMTCGLIPADAGRIWLGQADVTNWPMYRRAKDGHMGYLPQEKSIFTTLTTENNLYIMMELLGFSPSKQQKRCEELLEKFRLTKVQKTIVGSGGTGGVSGGERRRLEIARALLAEPKIILLDEPFANLDPQTVTELQNIIRTLSDEGIAILITDHKVEETLEITHRSYVIDSGKVLCSGPPAEVLANPEARKYYFGEKAIHHQRRVEQTKNIQTNKDNPAGPDPDQKPEQKEEPKGAPKEVPPGDPSGFIVRNAPEFRNEEFVVGESSGSTKPSSPPGPQREGLFDEFIDEESVKKDREKRRSLGLRRKKSDEVE